MLNIIRATRAGLFIIILLAPIASFFAFAPVPVHDRPFARFPTWAELTAWPWDQTRIMSAVLDRSLMRWLAIRGDNAFRYLVLGYIDTPLVVSGVGDWLYFKNQFWEGRCIESASFATDLARADTLVDVAQAAGVRLVFVVPPDKATVYPDKLNPAARAYAHCKAENAALWRALAQRIAPAIIDQAPPLLEAKARHGDRPLFFAADTHWTPYGAAQAWRQLVFELADRSIADIPEPQPSASAVLDRWTDLRNGVLALDGLERVPEVDADDAAAIAEAARRLNLGKTAAIRDSFYTTLDDTFVNLFPGVATYTPLVDIIIYRGAIEDADTIIAESVERQFFPRLNREYSWNGALGRTILARNQREAAACGSFQAVSGSAQAASSEPDALSAHRDVQIPKPEKDSEGALPCLQIGVTADEPGEFTIALPSKDSQQFEPGRSIRVETAKGSTELRLVLPAYVAGARIRIMPSGKAGTVKVTSAAVGLLVRR